MNRLTVERVKAAYAKTGATPTRGTFWTEYDPPDACAYGAVFVAETGFRRKPAGWGESLPLLDLEQLYAASFVAGFDVPDLDEAGRRAMFGRSRFDQQGYDDGRAASRAMGLS